MTEKITLATIAKACHLSVGTVSRALNDRQDISAETKAYVMQTAAQLGYRKNTPGEATPIRIGVVYCRERTAFYDQVTRGMREAQRALDDQNLTVDLLRADFLSQSSQLELLDALDPQAYDALLINSAGAETGKYIDRFLDAGLAVATFNTDAPSSRRLFFAGCSAYTAGQMGAYLLGKLVGGTGRVLLYGSLLGKSTWMDRFSSAYATLHQEFPEIEICPSFHELLVQDDVSRNALECLEQYSDLAGIFPLNCTSTCGIVEALRKLNRRDIRVVGFDITPETRQGILDGYCDAVLFQEPFAQGYLSMISIVKYLLDSTIPATAEVTITPQIVMKYNIDSF